MNKKLIKTLTTPNHTLALKTFRHYNDSSLPNNYATIAMQGKGGDKKYIVNIYELIKE